MDPKIMEHIRAAYSLVKQAEAERAALLETERRLSHASETILKGIGDEDPIVVVNEDGTFTLTFNRGVPTFRQCVRVDVTQPG